MTKHNHNHNHNHINHLITDNMDVWTSAIKRKSSSGRGSSKKIELYGIKKLRELILELAVRGKLVPQDPNDEPASVLLERIAQEKAQLVKEGKIKKSKKLPGITEDEKPFELPKGWEWSRLGLISKKLTDGSHNPAKNNGDGFPMLSGQNVNFGRIDFDNPSRYVDQINYEKEHSRTQVQENDILLTIVGSIGRSAVVPINAPKFVLQRSVAVIDSSIFSQFLCNQFISPICLKYYEQYGKGTAQKGIYLGQLSLMPIIIPPLLEQHRIVAKVDELMALCDQLEAQTESSLDAHQTLVTVLLDTLVNSQNTEELTENWTRISGHFDTLFTTEQSIDQLKQTILQLAVMGKLVEQNPNDEPASVLLERIAAEKADLIKQGKIKKQKPLPLITEDEKPFGLPEGWEWIRFASMSNEVATGPFGSMIHKRDYVTDGVPLINPSHMINSEIREDLTITVNIDKAKELRSYKLFENDIVMARRGEMGRCALVTKREENWLCGTGSFVLRFNDALSRRFILLLFRTSYVCGYLGGKSIGTTMTNLNHSILNKMPLLLPPVTEQHRIVAKVDELMAICEQLKARLSDAQTTQLKLADALVEQAL